MKIVKKGIKYFLIVVGYLMVSAPFFCAFAQEVVSIREAVGMIVLIDEPKKNILIHVDDEKGDQFQEILLLLDDSTVIKKDGVHGKVESLQVDDDVAVSYAITTTGKNMAMEIEVLSSIEEWE